jgi:hypothetical protein
MTKDWFLYVSEDGGKTQRPATRDEIDMFRTDSVTAWSMKPLVLNPLLKKSEIH